MQNIEADNKKAGWPCLNTSHITGVASNVGRYSPFETHGAGPGKTSHPFGQHGCSRGVGSKYVIRDLGWVSNFWGIYRLCPETRLHKSSNYFRL